MIVDLTTISEAVASLKTASEIAKTIKSLVGTKDTVAQEHIAKLYDAILTAQGSAISAKSDQLSLLQRISDLEKKISDFETWDSEKQRYELKKVGSGSVPVFVYSLKENASGTEPFHYICPKCFEHRHKSPIQATTRVSAGARVHFCPECKTELHY